jgi:hypothetical protein
MRRSEAEQDAAPARMVRTHASGRPGLPSGPTTRPRHWLADVDGLKAERSAAKRVKSPVALPKARSPAPKIAAVARLMASRETSSRFAAC